jgi:hypothetical protein
MQDVPRRTRSDRAASQGCEPTAWLPCLMKPTGSLAACTMGSDAHPGQPRTSLHPCTDRPPKIWRCTVSEKMS